MESSRILVNDLPQLRAVRISKSLSPLKQWCLLILGLIVSDAALVAFAFKLAFFVRFELSLPIFRLDVVPAESFYKNLGLFLIPCWLIVFALTGLYNPRNLLGGIKEYDLVFRGVTVGMLLVVVVGFLEPFFVFARGWLLLAWLFAFLGVASARFAWRRVVYRLRQHGYFLSPALIVGANDEGRSLAQQLLGWRTSGLYILGFVDDRVAAGTTIHEPLSVMGPVSALDELVARYGVKELILATSALSRSDMTNIFLKYGFTDNPSLRLSSGLYEIITTGLEVKEMGSVPLVCVNKVRMTGADRALKFALDYCIAIPALILLAPLLFIIALAVKLESPGPIIFRRRVMGLHGRQFDAYKFRTMYVNGDEVLAAYPELQSELERTHKLKDDPRVTRVGRLLRKLSLDELPQLVNVLKGEMSLVGPRIISPQEVEMYGQRAINLLTTPPGITGLWQVSGRSDISYEERVRLDMHYIRNWTIWLDVQLLLETIPAVLRARGAY